MPHGTTRSASDFDHTPEERATTPCSTSAVVVGNVVGDSTSAGSSSMNAYQDVHDCRIRVT